MTTADLDWFIPLLLGFPICALKANFAGWLCMGGCPRTFLFILEIVPFSLASLLSHVETSLLLFPFLSCDTNADPFFLALMLENSKQKERVVPLFLGSTAGP